MTTERIAKTDWEDYFNRVTKSLEGLQATVEVAALDTGDQIEAERLTLLGVTYDPKDDLLEVALEGLDHLIRHPRDIHITLEDTGITSIAVVDGNDREQIIRLSEPLLLPPPA
ncbi:MAG TPA: hypothetical protein ENJ99_04835 [Rhizobiales bacterium]|nr:hypothetical protein [Hyphomicrobiales bacterium]